MDKDLTPRIRVAKFFHIAVLYSLFLVGAYFCYHWMSAFVVWRAEVHPEMKMRIFSTGLIALVALIGALDWLLGLLEKYILIPFACFIGGREYPRRSYAPGAEHMPGF
jgi:hypothetical protein